MYSQLVKSPKDNTYFPFVLDKEKYADVEETPYGFIYNVNNHSITDSTAQRKKLSPEKFESGKDYGWTVTNGGEEIYVPSFEEAYKYAKSKK